jgi:hypothetical protein
MISIKVFVELLRTYRCKLLTREDTTEWQIGMNMEWFSMNSTQEFHPSMLRQGHNSIKMLEQEL